MGDAGLRLPIAVSLFPLSGCLPPFPFDMQMIWKGTHTHTHIYIYRSRIDYYYGGVLDIYHVRDS
jgi:hypothetical protein